MKCYGYEKFYGYKSLEQLKKFAPGISPDHPDVVRSDFLACTPGKGCIGSYIKNGEEFFEYKDGTVDKGRIITKCVLTLSSGPTIAWFEDVADAD